MSSTRDIPKIFFVMTLKEKKFSKIFQEIFEKFFHNFEKFFKFSKNFKKKIFSKKTLKLGGTSSKGIKCFASNFFTSPGFIVISQKRSVGSDAKIAFFAFVKEVFSLCLFTLSLSFREEASQNN